MHYFVSILVLQYLEEEEKVGCFVSIVLQMYCYYKYSLALPQGTWVGLQCVIVAFPDHAHLIYVIIVSLACPCCPTFSGICLHQDKKQRCQSGVVELYSL